MLKESVIQKRILKYLGELDNCWPVKIISCNKGGTPDILTCFKGKFYAIEVKRPGGKVSPMQGYRIDEITKAGGTAFAAYSLEDVKAVIG